MRPDLAWPDGPATYLVINRFDDEFGEYHRFLPPAGGRLVYIARPGATAPLASEHTLAIQVVPDTSIETVLPVARELSSRWGPFAGVVGLSEFDVLTAAQVREDLGVAGDRPSFVLRFRDKPLMKRLVAAAGLRAPMFSDVTPRSRATELVGAVGLPMIVKPRAGAASAGVRRVDTTTELERILEQAEPDLECEEFVDGVISHVDGLRRDGEFHFVTASSYVNTCLDFANGLPLGSVLLGPGRARDEILKFAGSCLDALGLENGPFHLEVIRTPAGELVFLEVGLRPGGAEVPFLHRDLLGVDLYGEAFRVTLGLPPMVDPVPELDGSGGWVIFPEPRPLPSRVVEATSLLALVPEVYAERVPLAGEVFDGTGVYHHVGGSFRLRGTSEAVVRRAIAEVVARYRLTAEALPAMSTSTTGGGDT